MVMIVLKRADVLSLFVRRLTCIFLCIYFFFGMRCREGGYDRRLRSAKKCIKA